MVMKKILAALLFFCSLAGPFSADTNQVGQAKQVTIKYPTDLMPRAAKGITPKSVDFILRPFLKDLRFLYCDPDTLKSRIDAGVCVIDFAYGDPWHMEIKVSPDTTLRDVLRSSEVQELQNWRGGQPPLRIVAKRAI